MQRELLLCVPGPWEDRSTFVQSVASETKGEFLFAGMILANPDKREYAPLDFAPPDPQMRRAFELAGQGKLPGRLLEQVAGHRGIAYLHFPVEIANERARVFAFTRAVQRCGGFAVKVDSAGIAHEWDQWFAALDSQNPFDLYRTFVVLIRDAQEYYSCGMHHFGLPDVEVECTVEINQAAALMNQFNFWQIVEKPELASGHTFSIGRAAPQYRISLKKDSRHDPLNSYHNPSGLWNLKRVD